MNRERLRWTPRIVLVAAVIGAASFGPSAGAQRSSDPLSIQAIADHLESVGVTPPPIELAKAYRDYVVAVSAANVAMPRRGDAANMSIEPKPWTEEDARGVERAMAKIDAAERELFGAVTLVEPDHAAAVDVARSWARIDRLSRLAYDQTSTLRVHGERLVPEPSPAFSAADRAALLHELGAAASTLERRLVEMNALFQAHSALTFQEQQEPAAVELERALFMALVKVFSAQWEIHRVVVARLPEPDRSRAIDRFIQTRVSRFGPQMTVDNGWIEPSSASPAQTLLRLRAMGAVTPANEAAVRARLVKLVEAERALGTRFIESLIASPEKWNEGETRYERARSLWAATGESLAAERLTAANELAEIAEAPWLVDQVLEQPPWEPGRRLSAEDAALVGEASASGRATMGSDEIRTLLAVPPKLRSGAGAEWVALFALPPEGAAIVDGLIEFAEMRWMRTVVPLLTQSETIAITLSQKVDARTRAMRSSGSFNAVELSDEERGNEERDVRELARLRIAAWKEAVAIIDEFREGLAQFGVKPEGLALVSLAPRAALARRVAQASVRVMTDAAGGAPTIPIELVVAWPIELGAREPWMQVPDSLVSGAAPDAALLDAAAGSAPLLEPAIVATEEVAEEWLAIELGKYAGWSVRPKASESQPLASDRRARGDALAEEALVRWRTAERAYVEAVAARRPERAKELHARFDEAAFPYATAATRFIRQLRRDLAAAGVATEEYEPIIAIVESAVNEPVARAIAIGRAPISKEEHDANRLGERHDVLRDRMTAITTLVTPAITLSGTPSWVLARTLPPEVAIKCKLKPPAQGSTPKP